MTRKDFLNILDRNLATLPYGERESALRYYEEYFDDAGVENEQRVISELGSPEALAKVIIAQSELGETIRNNRSRQDNDAKASDSGAMFGKFTSLNIDVLNSKIVIQRGTSQIINLDYPEDVELPECELRGDTLYIIDKKRQKFRWFGGWNSNWQPCSIYITLTADRYDMFMLKTLNGNIELSDIWLDSMKAENVNGSLSASRINSRELKLSNVNGSIKAENCVATELSKGDTVNGSLRMEGDLRGNVSAGTVNGSVRLEVDGCKNDYNLKLSTLSGSVRVNGDKQSKSTTIMMGGANTINASTVNGSVNINFSR